ncbi:MAG: biotin transporter BioY [Oscillospiraceae bacterium]|nr:biotin transporter BioY [Oscillospiraceae bacterium]
MRIRYMTRCAIFVGAMALCAWLAVPLAGVPVTMQTLGFFLALGLLGSRLGMVTVGVYLIIGAVGLPVFSGFQGGFAILLGPTGGFLWGFLIAAGLNWLLEKWVPLWVRMVLCQLVIYLCGLIWFSFLYGESLWAVAMVTVLPYLLPDAAKLILSLFLILKLRQHLYH